MKLEDLHDATLLDLRFDWSSGVILILFSTDLDTTLRVQMTLEEAKTVTLSREFPWGESVSVNEIRVEDIKEGKKCEIEMQSGDVLTFECSNLILSEEGP